MPTKESIEEIVQFVKNNKDPVSKRQIADHIRKLPQALSLTYTAVSHQIDKLVEDSKLIKLEAPWKRGQRQYFIANPKDEFSQIRDIIFKLRSDFMIIKKRDNPRNMRGSELDVIETYNKLWTPYMNQWRTHLDILQNRTFNTIPLDKEAKILYDRITQLRIDMNNEDFRVSRYVNQLKEYLKDKSTSKV